MEHDASGLLEILGALESLAWPIAIARLVGAWHQIAFVGVTYILSLGLGHYLVLWGLNFFLGKNRKGGPHPRAWGVGCIERIIYTSCLLLGMPFALIGGWLVLKGLAEFTPRRIGKPTTEEFLTDYYSYLIGTCQRSSESVFF